MTLFYGLSSAWSKECLFQFTDRFLRKNFVYIAVKTVQVLSKCLLSAKITDL